MAILNGRDLLSAKYTTAEISDANDQVHYVPIKNMIGDYFVAELNGQLFAFTMKGARILTHRKTATKSFRVVQFDTSHYSSIKPETKALEIVLKKNALHPVDRMLHDVLRVLGRREKETFGKFLVGNQSFDTEVEANDYLDSLNDEDKKITTVDEDGHEVTEMLKVKWDVHDIDDLIRIFRSKEGEFPKQVQQMKQYLDELDVKQVVTPVRKITDFIQKDLIATSPSYLGGLLLNYHRVNGELRKLTNSPEKPTGSFMKIAVIGLIIGMGVFAVAFMANEGYFDGVMEFTDNLGTIQEGFKGIPSPTQGIQRGGATAGGAIDYSDDGIMASYPEPCKLKEDVNNGIVDYNKLSTFVQDMVDDLEC